MNRSTDNTEGSLTEVQKQILIGVLLGDGAMRKKTNALLEINHSYVQKDYVDWLYQKLSNFILTPPKQRKGNGNRLAYRFTTRSLPIFTKYYDLFFKNKHKIIPEQFDLSPLSIAIWYMDDGSCCKNNVYLNTQQFSLKEQEELIKHLYQKYKIKASLNKDKKYFRIRIKKESVLLFISMVDPFIIPSMRYKLLL